MEKILIVENDFIVRDNISSLLYEEGYHPLLAENGFEALEVIEKESPALIISDISMPKMDGFELLRKIRNNPDTKLLPLIFLIAKTEKETIRKGMNEGADDFIPKPFAPEEILDTIERTLNNNQRKVSVIRENKLK